MQRRHLWALALLLGGPWWATAARAQIYAWRDAKGTLVLADRPLDPRAVTVAASERRPASTAGRMVDAGRAPRYEPLIREHAATFGVRPELVRAVIQAESRFNPWAVSPKGAMGLMQLMPATAEALGVANPFDPAENIRAGVQYLGALLAQYGHNEELALAAYNAGPEAVARYGGRVPPFPETRTYVRRISESTALRRSTVIYKTVEVINGRRVLRLTNVRPADRPVNIASTPTGVF